MVPGSKSISNRALLIAALAEGQSQLEGLLLSDDTEACLAALSQLQVKFNFNYKVLSLSAGHKFSQDPRPEHQLSFNCQDAGTVTRFLLPICAAIGGRYHFYASARMMARPLAPLLQALSRQGVKFKFLEEPWSMPLEMESKGLPGGELELNLSASSQFLSGLMLAAPYAKSPLVLKAKNLAAKPYVSMTAKMMAHFGMEVWYVDDSTLKIAPGCYRGRSYHIEPDASTASYFFAAAALTGGKVLVRNLYAQSLQGDLKFLEVLAMMGCVVQDEPEGLSVTAPMKLKALSRVDMSGFSDTFMTLAMLAPFTDAPMTLVGLRHTRLQESDRVAAVAEGLTRAGIKVETGEDQLTIYPGKIKAAVIDSHRDHRVVMSFALLGLITPGLSIAGAECVRKTCPNYFELMQALIATSERRA